MEPPQNSTNTENKTEVIPELVDSSVVDELTPQQLMFIDYKAIGGWVTEADASVPKKMPMQEFADKIQVDRTTLYNWQKSIPDFWDRVSDRRRQIGSQERLIKIHDTWYLKALGGSFPHLQLWLANFDPEFRMPAQKVEHEMGNSWAALLQNKRKLIESKAPNHEPPANNS